MLYERNDLWTHLAGTDKPIYLYGMGNGADKILAVLDSLGIHAKGVFASDDFVRYQIFHGYTVCSYADARSRDPEMIVLVSFGTQLDEVISNILRIDKEQELYAPFVPLFGDDLFDLSYCDSHGSDLEKVYSMLDDDLSRHVFSSILTYRVTGKISYLMDATTEKDEIFQRFSLGERPSFVDLGAYNGDTIREFCSLWPEHSRIFAMEPDRKNFRKLVSNTMDIPYTTLCNACSGSADGSAYFAQKAGRNSSISQKGNIKVPMYTVDSMVCDSHVSYIKMDVEGNEADSIRGAAGTIKKDHPSMLISAYHRSEDLFSLPLLVDSISGGYRILMRHHRYIPDWDTNYYFL
ncbi:MAG: FkbM family methyltransferase [Clostridia bacterium]|nr:FkbM family methyltransferase [Clostridia bacterium]